MKLRILLSLCVIALLGFVVFKTIDLNELYTTLKRFPPLTLYVALFIATILTVLKTWRFTVLLQRHDIHVPFWQLLRLFAASQAITPLPGGEASRGFLLKKESGLSTEDIASPVLMQALLELFCAVIIVILGSFFYHTLLGPAIVALCILLSAIVLLTHVSLVPSLLEKGARWSIVRKHKERILHIHADLRNNLFHQDTRYPSTAVLFSIGIGLLTQLTGGLLLLVISGGYGEQLSLFEAAFVYSAGVAIQGMATISPGGVGFTEGGMTGILALFDIQHALAIVIIFRAVTLLYYTLFGLALIGLFYRKDFFVSRRKKATL
jgi:uncharacterized protein (TIRG00374 family)